MTLHATAAALTPLSPAGIAVVRLSGPGADALLTAVFRPRSPASTNDWPDDRLRFGQILDGDEILDDAIVAIQRDRRGIRHIDFNIHGGPRIVQRLLLTLESAGARIVPPEAVAGDAWPAANAIEREAWTLLPAAQTRRAAAWLLRQRDLLPAVVRQAQEQLEARSGAALDDLRQAFGAFAAAGHMLHGFSLAIIGPPNAGKSTLANALCGTERVLVSDLPGTTRDYVTQTASIDGVPVTLIDTAGLRSVDDPLESEAIARAREQAARADLRLLVVDGSTPPAAETRQLLAGFERQPPALLVLNKSDLPARFVETDIPSAWTDRTVAISAAYGDGLTELRSRITSMMGIDGAFDRRPAVFSERQHAVATRALSAMEHDPKAAIRALDEMNDG